MILAAWPLLHSVQAEQSCCSVSSALVLGETGWGPPPEKPRQHATGLAKIIPFHDRRTDPSLKTFRLRCVTWRDAGVAVDRFNDFRGLTNGLKESYSAGVLNSSLCWAGPDCALGWSGFHFEVPPTAFQ